MKKESTEYAQLGTEFDFKTSTRLGLTIVDQSLTSFKNQTKIRGAQGICKNLYIDFLSLTLTSQYYVCE